MVRWHGADAVRSFLRSLVACAKAEHPDALVSYANYPSTEYLTVDFTDFVCFNVYLHDTSPPSADTSRGCTYVALDQPLVLTEFGVDLFGERERRNNGASCLGKCTPPSKPVSRAPSSSAWTDEMVHRRSSRRELGLWSCRSRTDPGRHHAWIARPAARGHRPPAGASNQRPGQFRGISALSRVPRPRELSMWSRPPRASIRSARPTRPVPLRGSAPPTPSSVTTTVTLPFDRSTADRCVCRLRVLRDVRRRLCDEVVDGHFDRLGQSLLRDLHDTDRDGRAIGECVERRLKSLRREGSRVDSPCELSQLAEGLFELVVRLAQHRFRSRGVSREGGLDELELKRERDEPLLRAVVQVALQSAPLAVGRFDDPRA